MPKRNDHIVSGVISIIVAIITAFITTLITNSYNVIYTAGKYIEKIDHLETTSDKQDESIQRIKSKISNMVSILQPDYPNINLDAYLDNAAQHNIPPNKIVKGLQELKIKDSTSGTQYLMDYYNFTNDQAKSVFTPTTNSNPSH